MDRRPVVFPIFGWPKGGAGVKNRRSKVAKLVDRKRGEELERGKVVRRVALDEVPGWAKPILAAALGPA